MLNFESHASLIPRNRRKTECDAKWPFYVIQGQWKGQWKGGKGLSNAK